jgi:hypothetical protein
LPRRPRRKLFAERDLALAVPSRSRSWASTAAVTSVTGAQAANPTVTPVKLSTTTIPAGKGCPFKVTDKVAPSTSRVERVFSNGRHLSTGTAKETLSHGARSVTVDGSGSIGYRKRADGTTPYTFGGSTVLFFYPGR